MAGDCGIDAVLSQSGNVEDIDKTRLSIERDLIDLLKPPCND
jgi:hypothetical protein